MKKTFFLLLFGFLGILQGMSYPTHCVRLVEEGMKWVNEKVIINHGDTTYSYYTYEITGEDVPEKYSLFNPSGTKACHYYTGSQIDPENDSIVSYLIQWDWNVGYSLNRVQAKTEREGRNLLEVVWYMTEPNFFGTTYYDLYYCLPPADVNIGQYLFHQIDSVLNEDNFIEVDPVEIEGETCQRLAHVNEEGEVLFYVVEGIGFDSRDMGDLLSPFLRQPDPDADYQEYWGLSHVIKDGKIIYKGMRYNEDHLSAVGEVAADSQRAGDANYYNLMGQPVGKDVPTTSGIYIHQGKKIIVR